MRNPGGVGILYSPDGTIEEHDTFTCAHFPCQKIVRVHPYGRPEDIGGFCYGCGKPICPDCVGKPCSPLERGLTEAERPLSQEIIEKGIAAMEARDRLRRELKE